MDNVRVVTVYMVMLNPSEKKATGFNPVYVNAVVNPLSPKCSRRTDKLIIPQCLIFIFIGIR